MSNHHDYMSGINEMARNIWESRNRFYFHRYIAILGGVLCVLCAAWAIRWWIPLFGGVFLILYGVILQPRYLSRTKRTYWVFSLKMKFLDWRLSETESLNRNLTILFEKSSQQMNASIYGIPEFDELIHRLTRYIKEPNHLMTHVSDELGPAKRQLIIDISLFLVLVHLVELFDENGAIIENTDIEEAFRSEEHLSPKLMRFRHLVDSISSVSSKIDSNLFNCIHNFYTGVKA